MSWKLGGALSALVLLASAGSGMAEGELNLAYPVDADTH